MPRRSAPSAAANAPLPDGHGLDTGGLEGWLWSAACSIRGAVDAPKFKDYILPLIFVKRLSDVFDDEIERLAEKFGDRTTALELVEEDHSLVRFFVPPTAAWSKVRKLTSKLGQRLTEVVRDVAKANPSLQGVIDIVDFNATVSGQRIVEDARLSKLIEILSRHRLGLEDVEPDILGRAYEYLLRKFAEGQGQSAGEFFTPKEVGWLIARLLAPVEGMAMYDPTSGSAGLLIKAQLVLREENPHPRRPLRLYGQELNHATFAIGRMNMIIHDMEGEIAIGDTLRNPRFLDGAHLELFDLVAANPMWNQPGYDTSFYEADGFDRFEFGYPPGNTADWGWLQHMTASLNDRGRAAVVLDAAAVTRGSGEGPQHKEKAIRRGFVENDLVEGVILLPENLFYNTPAQGIIIVLNRAKPKARRGGIMLVDASLEFERDRPKNVLTVDGTARIVKAFRDWKSIDGFAAVITGDEAASKDFNLNPARYVARTNTRVAVELGDAVRALDAIDEQRKVLQKQVTKLLDSLVPAKASDLKRDGWQRIVFGDVAEFSLGRTPPRKRRDYFSTTDGEPWVTITDMADQKVVTATKELVTKTAVAEVFRNRRVKAGTLLMSIKLTVGRTAFLGVDGFHNEAIVSILPDEDVVLAKYLYYVLPLVDYREHQDRAVKGQTINSGKLRQLEIFVPPVEEQSRIVAGLEAIEGLVNNERQALEHTRSLKDELVFRFIRGEMRARTARG